MKYKVCIAILAMILIGSLSNCCPTYPEIELVPDEPTKEGPAESPKEKATEQPLPDTKEPPKEAPSQEIPSEKQRESRNEPQSEPMTDVMADAGGQDQGSDSHRECPHSHEKRPEPIPEPTPEPPIEKKPDSKPLQVLATVTTHPLDSASSLTFDGKKWFSVGRWQLKIGPKPLNPIYYGFELDTDDKKGISSEERRFFSLPAASAIDPLFPKAPEFAVFYKGESKPICHYVFVIKNNRVLAQCSVSAAVVGNRKAGSTLEFELKVRAGTITSWKHSGIPARFRLLSAKENGIALFEGLGGRKILPAEIAYNQGTPYDGNLSNDKNTSPLHVVRKTELFFSFVPSSPRTLNFGKNRSRSPIVQVRASPQGDALFYRTSLKIISLNVDVTMTNAKVRVAQTVQGLFNAPVSTAKVTVAQGKGHTTKNNHLYAIIDFGKNTIPKGKSFFFQVELPDVRDTLQPGSSQPQVLQFQILQDKFVPLNTLKHFSTVSPPVSPTPITGHLTIWSDLAGPIASDGTTKGFTNGAALISLPTSVYLMKP